MIVTKSDHGVQLLHGTHLNTPTAKFSPDLTSVHRPGECLMDCGTHQAPGTALGSRISELPRFATAQWRQRRCNPGTTNDSNGPALL
jgi:hypothetical protein